MEEKKNTMENMTEEQELTEAEKFLIKKSQECPPFTHDGLNQLPYILVPAVAKCMDEFVQFSLYKDHPTTASGSVAAPKEDERDALIKAQSDYIDFLSAAIAQPVSFLHTHNWNYSEEDIEKGKKLREVIERARKTLNQ